MTSSEECTEEVNNLNTKSDLLNVSMISINHLDEITKLELERGYMTEVISFEILQISKKELIKFILAQ